MINGETLESFPLNKVRNKVSMFSPTIITYKETH